MKNDLKSPEMVAMSDEQGCDEQGQCLIANDSGGEKGSKVVKVDESVVVLVVQQNNNSLTNVYNNNDSKSIPELIPAFGLIMVILNAMTVSIGSVLVKFMPELHPFELLLFRSIMQFVFFAPLALVGGHSLLGQTGERMNLTMRGVYGTVGSMGAYIAFSSLPLSDATTLLSTTPIFVTLLAYVLLKEPLTLIQVLTGVITLTGVVVIARPEFMFGTYVLIVENRIPGLLYACLGSLGTALAMITLRKLKTTPVPVIVVWYSIVVLMATFIGLLVLNEFRWPMSWRSWSLLLVVGIVGIGEQYFLTVGLRYETAGPASIARTISIVFAFILDALVLDIMFDGLSVVGALLVSTGVIVLGVHKWTK